MSEQYIGITPLAAGAPVPGLRATTPDTLPEIDNYDDVADLPTAYNELSAATQAALLTRLTQGSVSAASTVSGFRKITVSTSAPSGGADGDVWFQVEA